jgi:hypothetical protein
VSITTEFESRSGWGVEHYVMKFDSDLRQVSPGIPVFSTNKPDRHDIAEILLKVALSTIKQTNKHTFIPKLNRTIHRETKSIPLTHIYRYMTTHYPGLVHTIIPLCEMMWSCKYFTRERNMSTYTYNIFNLCDIDVVIITLLLLTRSDCLNCHLNTW